MKIKQAVAHIKRRFTVNRRKKQLRVQMPTIICRDCVAGIIYHDTAQRFTSPTVNLYMPVENFLTFCEHLREYCDANTVLKEVDSEFPYPAGVLHREQLPEIKIFFMHYRSFEEGKKKWEERCGRIDFENVVIVLPLVNITEDVTSMLDRFNALPYKKVALVNQSQPTAENTYVYTKEEFDYEGTENLLSYRKENKFYQWRYLDCFNYVEFINTGRIEKRPLK